VLRGPGAAAINAAPTSAGPLGGDGGGSGGVADTKGRSSEVASEAAKSDAPRAGSPAIASRVVEAPREASSRPAGGSGDRAAEAKALYDKAQEALDAGDATRALDQASASLKVRRTARTYLVRAQAEQRLGRVAEALGSIDAAAQIAPDLASVWEFRGRILWAARRREDARVAFEKFLALEPDGARAASVRRLLNEPR
jgi:tetratricopeptide (TPR) repeat protein